MLIWCKYLTISVEESVEQLEKSLDNPCHLREAWWSGENAWTGDGDGIGENLGEGRWRGENAWSGDGDSSGKNLCAGGGVVLSGVSGVGLTASKVTRVGVEVMDVGKLGIGSTGVTAGGGWSELTVACDYTGMSQIPHQLGFGTWLAMLMK